VATVLRKSRVKQADGPVLRVTDGDTFVMEYLDLGWGHRIFPIDSGEPGHCAIRVTLPGCKWFDAPERGDNPGYTLAKNYAKTLLEPGTWVNIVSYGFSAGRTLASVTLPDGRDLATLMIEAGHVK
jgi:endonuclease YncB( thermonuclease family)